jgi:uncharacterized damage-inducible protein DinB
MYRLGRRYYLARNYERATEQGRNTAELDANFAAFTDGAPGRMSREEMLIQVITHGVGHRGQESPRINATLSPSVHLRRAGRAPGRSACLTWRNSAWRVIASGS